MFISQTLFVNNNDHSYISESNKIDEEDFAMVDPSVDEVKG